MTKSQLDQMVKGWFVGDFAPTALHTTVAEVGVKRYQAGECEPWHCHKIATEVTLILEGEVEMNGARHRAGEIIRLDPGEGTDFRAVTDVTTVVVKLPSVIGDKYVGEGKPPC